MNNAERSISQKIRNCKGGWFNLKLVSLLYNSMDTKLSSYRETTIRLWSINTIIIFFEILISFSKDSPNKIIDTRYPVINKPDNQYTCFDSINLESPWKKAHKKNEINVKQRNRLCWYLVFKYWRRLIENDIKKGIREANVKITSNDQLDILY